MPKILFTVDTEIGDRVMQYYNGDDAFDWSIQGIVGNKSFGTNFIMDILDENKLTGEFF